MIWKKLGKIFDPAAHNLPAGCVEFAQSPQAVVIDDYVRIYFSSREKEANGKFLSHILFADFDKHFNAIIKIAEKPVIALGALGTFDEHGIFPFSPLHEENRFVAYTCGWSRRTSVSVETATGFVISEDNGTTFKRIGTGPIMSSSLHEPFLVGDSFVQKYNGMYYMWYIYGVKWKETDNEGAARVYKIAQAISEDGLTWQRDSKQIISSTLNEDECQALPTVAYFQGRYHMFFCFREATDFRNNKHRGYKIGYAYSDDLVVWHRDDENIGIKVSESSWDSDMMCYPNVFVLENKMYLLYNGNEFGRNGFGLAVLENS